MKNMFGDEVDPATLRLEIFREGEHLYLRRSGKLVGLVSANGWTGKSRHIAWPIGEPILQVFSGNSYFSLTELQQIQNEWEKKS